MAEGAEPASLRERGEGGRLVVAALRQAGERLLAEDVDAAADPVREEPRLLEAGDPVVLAQLDDPEGRARMRHRDRRGGPRRAVPVEERREVDVEQLVAVQRVDVAFLPARGCGEAQSSPAAERLRLGHGDELGPEACELGLE
jgi:hypothetical protein